MRLLARRRGVKTLPRPEWRISFLNDGPAGWQAVCDGMPLRFRTQQAAIDWAKEHAVQHAGIVEWEDREGELQGRVNYGVWSR
jgi:hypothetical protein